MENTVKKYLDGNDFAKEELLEEIMETYNNTITKHEAIILLHKKYGKPVEFW